MSEYTYLYSDAQATNIIYPYTKVEAVEGLSEQIIEIKESTGKDISITCPANVVVTLSNDKNSYTTTSSSDGNAYFSNVALGEYTLTISKGGEIASKNITIKADNEVTLSFFTAYINVTYPEGSTLTCSDGSTTLTATTTTGSYTFTVPNAGTWTVSCSSGSNADSATMTITTNGESQSVELQYEYVLIPGSGVFDNKATYGQFSSCVDDGDGTYTIVSQNSGRCTVPIDVTKYTTMTIKGSRTASESYLRLGLFSSATNTTFSPASDFVVGYSDSIHTAATIDGTYDLSSVTGTLHFGIQTLLNDEYLQTMTILLDSVVFA